MKILVPFVNSLYDEYPITSSSYKIKSSVHFCKWIKEGN